MQGNYCCSVTGSHSSYNSIAVIALSLGLPLMLACCSKYMFLYILHVTFSYAPVNTKLDRFYNSHLGSVSYLTDFANIHISLEQKYVLATD